MSTRPLPCLQDGVRSGSEIRFDAAENAYIVDEDQDGSMTTASATPTSSTRLPLESGRPLEYRPGSVLYLVWSQGREANVPDGEFSFRHDFDELFDVYPHDIFLIKVSRWFSW